MACETFCLDTDESFSSATLHSESLTIDTVRLVPVNETISFDVQLGKYHNKNVIIGKTKRKPRNLHRSATATRSTVLVEIVANNAQYEPGDHVGIFPANRKEIVDGIMNRLSGVDNFDEILQLQLLKENHTTNGMQVATVIEFRLTDFCFPMKGIFITKILNVVCVFLCFRRYKKLGTA